MSSTLYLVIPCYNEEAVLTETSIQLQKKLKHLIKEERISKDSRIIFVDDGSKDSTWQLIEKLSERTPLFGGIKLSRNRGHQYALLAGLMTVKDKADVVISMDADLQDDINAIDGMLSKYESGSEIVYGVRSSRAKDTFFKKTTAQAFYKLMSRMGVDSVYNHADYRLMSSRALNELGNFKEYNLFLRGIVPLLGFKTDIVEYERAERFAGESKYPLRKMLSFAIEGITSFSIRPLRVVTNIGFFVSVISLVVMIYTIVVKIFGQTVDGWAFTVISVWFIGGVQMLGIGIVGEYTGKIYSEVKARPRYIVEKEL